MSPYLLLNCKSKSPIPSRVSGFIFEKESIEREQQNREPANRRNARRTLRRKNQVISARLCFARSCHCACSIQHDGAKTQHYMESPIMKNICCCHCGSKSLEHKPGTPPHALRLDCAACGKFVKWVSHRDADQAKLNYPASQHATQISLFGGNA